MGRRAEGCRYSLSMYMSLSPCPGLWTSVKLLRNTCRREHLAARVRTVRKQARGDVYFDASDR